MNYYNPYQQPYYGAPAPDQLSQLRQGYQPQQQVGAGINWCQGEAAARAYMVAPGNTVLLMDSDASTFYLKSSDANGMPQPLRIFDYTERTQAARQAPQAVEVDYVTRKEFDALTARLDALGAKPAKVAKQKEDNDNG